MTSSVKLESLVNSLVESAPPTELPGVSKDLSTLLSQQGSSSIIEEALEDYVQNNAAIFSSTYIASKYNKDPHSSKYIDFVNNKKFNIDLKTQRAIDFESYEPEVQYPSYYNDLATKLIQYGEDHYPSTYAYTLIPKDSGELVIILIGQRLNSENYFTGQWKSIYTLKDGTLSGEVSLDIHYYEDGNVRLNFNEKVNESLAGSNAGAIVNAINDVENKITLQIVENFNELNQRYFKNLRRLLPITRSKINWGSAIGNYRLGSDVVHKQ
ncbi:F-actin-capping protein subunit alpha [Scheffersomyces xylosifermentans]|uniref:F-actin-capping protein subunit alpha n=1 Tax=Scheffersomyces xylosifermentans TaxID=1304137 RepID=UPI00315CEBF5